MTEPLAVDLSVMARGDVSSDMKEYARDKIFGVCRLVSEPILFAEIRLAVERDPARDRPAIVEVMLDVNGTPIRAQVAAGDLPAAVDVVEMRLRTRMERYLEQRHHKGRERTWNGTPRTAEWRHGDLVPHRPQHFPRPVEDREIVRRKTFDPSPMTVDEAAYDLDLLGHWFYLFTELKTGTDSVLYHADGRLELMQLEGAQGDPLREMVTEVHLMPPAPVLPEEEAVERLVSGGEPFVFYGDVTTARGCVLYNRYDGHYGMITLA